MELLNGIGESLDPMFNNQLRAVPERQNPKPIWLQSSLKDTELAQLLGETQPEDPNGGGEDAAAKEEESKEEALGEKPSEEKAVAEKVVNEKVVNEGAEADQAMPEQDNAETSLDIEALAVENAEPETSKPDAERTTSLPEAAIPKKPVDSPEGSSKTTNPKPPAPDKKPIVIKEPERISPTSTLGGSARELLNADGTQR